MLRYLLPTLPGAAYYSIQGPLVIWLATTFGSTRFAGGLNLGIEEARRRGTQKSILERKAPPTFDVIVEIQDRERVLVHADVAQTVDAMLLGDVVTPELRWRTTRMC